MKLTSDSAFMKVDRPFEKADAVAPKATDRDALAAVDAASTLTQPPTLSARQGTRRFEDRSLNISHITDDEIITKIFEGNAAQIDEIFFPKQENPQTIVMREIISDLLLSPEKVQFKIDVKDVKNSYIQHQGSSYLLYSLLGKVKWDLITLTPQELEIYLKNSQEEYGYSDYGTIDVPMCNDKSKSYLYANLHDVEKIAISVYKSSGVSLNNFLRGVDSFSFQQQDPSILSSHFRDHLMHVAVLASALNHIPASVEGYTYRCVADCKLEEGEKLIGTTTRNMRNLQKFKEKGFTSMSLYKPLKSFFGHSREDTSVKIYKNPKQLAKDISGLGAFEDEFECLLLPNTKDAVLREVVYDKKNIYSQHTDSKMHLYITKLISKRQNVI